MYIIELIAKYLKDKGKGNGNTVIPDTETDESYERCDHTFFPVDSTGQTLACSKCGFLIKNDPEKIKPKNPFFS